MELAASDTHPEATGVLGPPWRVVKRFGPDTLALDPPVIVACNAHAAWDSTTRTLKRCASETQAQQRAAEMSARSGKPAEVLRGAMQLRSGAWFWPASVLRVQSHKALNPLHPADRTKIAEALAKILMRAGTRAEKAMLTKSISALDLKWDKMTESQFVKMAIQVNLLAQGIPKAASMRAAFKAAEPILLRTARGSTRSNKLVNAAPSLALKDVQAVKNISKDMPFWFTNEYGRRAQAWEKDARGIIARGVAQGLDQHTVGKDLHGALKGKISGRSEAYYRTVASVAMTRASSIGQLSGYEQADITYYVWTTVLDERTCNICLLMDGQVVDVVVARDQVARMERAASPDAMIAVAPFYTDVDGDIHVRGPGGTLGPLMGRVQGEGRDKVVSVEKPLADAAGTTMPPAHELCRCYTIPSFKR